jgi:hypothetical protein
METGLALFVGGKPAEAAAEFDAGYAEHPYSAFLFNAGVCYQKLGDKEKALQRYRDYLRVDPSAPDVETVQKRVAGLEAERAAALPPPPASAAPEGSAAPPPPPPPPPVEQPASGEDAMRSLVVVETEPPGAPLKVYFAESDATPAFRYGAENPAWKQVAATVTPTSLSLAVGRYHVVVDKFRDFNVSETDMKVSAGHVHQFKANLSQGAFMSFLRVSANVTGAHVWLDDAKKVRPEWGTTPYGELVPAGDHEVLVEIPGFQPLFAKVQLVHGEQKELEVRLVRTDFGLLRVDSDAPDAKVRIDDEPKGIWRSGEPPLDVKVAAGKHHLVVDSEGHKALDTMVDVPRGQVLPVHAKLIPKYPRGGAWTQAIFSGIFLGTGVFLGAESNKLYDQLAADRAAGVLDDSDSRISRGRIYAIGADCAFVAGAGLAALATYSFVRDPMPESTGRYDKPQEFDDPLKARPLSAAPRAPSERIARRREPERSRLTAGPSALGAGAGGFVLGGTF